MRRTSRSQKPRKSETDDDEVSSLEASVDENKSKSIKKRSKGLSKTNSDEDDKLETEEQENDKTLNKRKKDSTESIENDSDEEFEKPISKKKKGRQEKDGSSENDNTDTSTNKKKKGKDTNGIEKSEQNGKSSSKSSKKSKDVEQESDEEYEVEKIVDQRNIKGRRQFLVRWKGYTEEADTWEQEDNLNCDGLIEEFLAEQENETENKDKKEKSEKKTKNKKSKKESRSSNGRPKNTNNDADTNEDNDNDDSVEYEVEKILEVHFRKDKKREFLIRWKGFSSKSDTWEPEENLNCPELINKFMEKLEKIKNLDSRVLRINPAHTNRYTLTMHADKRQSRRNVNKQRKTYFEN